MKVKMKIKKGLKKISRGLYFMAVFYDPVSYKGLKAKTSSRPNRCYG